MRRFLAKIVLLMAILGPAAAMTPYLVATMLSTQATAAGLLPRRTMDAAVGVSGSGGWFTQKPPVPNAAILATNGSETEWVWQDKLYDGRDDFSVWGNNRANWDIEQVRIIADTTYLFFYVEVDWWAVGGDSLFQFNIAIDTGLSDNPASGSGFNWFGDDANTTLGYAAQRSEVNVSFDADGIWKFYDQAYVQPWAQIGTHGTDIRFNQSGGFMEARVRWSDLGFTSVPSRIRLTMASARRMNWGSSPSAADKTEEVPTGGSSNMLDAVELGIANHTDAWADELSDGSVGTYVDIAFRSDGNCANTAPSAPSNLRVYDHVQSAWFGSGDTVLTNNPWIAWNHCTDSDVGDTIVGYYIQVCTGAAVGGEGFFHYGPSVYPAIGVGSTGTGPDNKIVWLNNFTSQNWMGPADSAAGIRNAWDYDIPMFQMGQTYYVRVWARDRRGMLSATATTLVLPIDYPVWHDPYAFQSFGASKSTYRGNRDPKEDATVHFMVGTFDASPKDPKDYYYYHAANNETATNEILNVTMHIRVARAGHFTYDAAWSNAARVLLGNQNEWGGTNRWYATNVEHPSYGNATDPNDTHTIWKTGGNINAAHTPIIDFSTLNTGNGAGTTYGLQSVAGDVVEYFFEINNPYEAPTGGAWRQSRAPRRFLISYDDKGITGYRMGTWDEAKVKPFRFVVQKRDLTAVWHNPLSTEVPLGPGGDTLAMRTPMWPDTAPQTVKMYVGCIGWGGMGLQMVWRNVDSGGWTTTNFSGGNGTLVDAASVKYYYVHEFNYTGGMIEYYFKANTNDLYIFANGITSSSDTVYENSTDPAGVSSVPFRFPFTSRVKMTSRASTGKDTHSIVAVLGFKAPRFDAMNRNAIGVNGVLDLRSCSTAVAGNGFANAFPGSQIALNDSWAAAEPRRLIGRSYFALLTATSNAITGIRKAFFGPIYPIDYEAPDTTMWNTGSDAYENVPILNYEEVFSEVIERTEAAGTVFSAIEPLEGTVYVPGDATVNTVSVTQGALIADGSITIPAGQVVTGERLDLCALGGPLTINGTVDVETGIAFSNQNIVLGPTGKLRIRRLGTMTAQAMAADTGSEIHINHPSSMSFSATKESVLTRATRWVISALRETRR